MDQTNNYYLIKNQYKHFDNGAIVQHDDKWVWQIQDEKKLELNESPPSDWIAISQNEAFFLKGKCCSQRNDIHCSGMFDKINKLKKNDTCIYSYGNLKHKCTIVDRIDNNNGLSFTVMDDVKEEQLNMCANDIELSSEDRYSSIDNKYYFSLDKYKINEPSGIVVINEGQLKNYLGDNISNISVKDVHDSYVEIFPDEARSLYNVYLKWKKGLEEKLETPVDNKYYFSLHKIDESCSIVIIKEGKVMKFLGHDLSKVSVEDVQNSYVEIFPDEARSLYNVYVKWKLGFVDKHLNSMMLRNCKEEITSDNKLNTQFFPGIFDKSDKFTKENYDQLKSDFENIMKSYNNNEVLKRFVDGSFIEFTTEALKSSLDSIKNHRDKDDLKIDFAVLTLKILCHVSRENKDFDMKIQIDKGIMNELKQMFDILTKKDRLVTKEKTILNYILYLYWCILRSGRRTAITISEAMEHHFKDSKFDKTIKIGMALCLSYLTVSSCAMLGELYLFLSNVYNENPLYGQYFTQDDILIGLGTLSLNLDYDYILLGKLKRSLNNVYKLLEFDNPEFTNDLHSELQNIYKNLCMANKDSMNEVMYKFIKMAQLIVETFYKKYLSNQEKMMLMDKIILDCAMTTLSIICDLCDTNTVFVTIVVGNIGLMANLKKIFNKLIEKIEPLSIEGQFLEIIIFIYWNIIKSRASFDNDIIPKIGHCYKCPNVNDQVKVAAALCLSVWGAESHEDRLDIGSYLETLCTKEPLKLYGFSWTEICVGVANIALVTKSFNEKDQLNTNEDNNEVNKPAECETIRGLNKDEYERCLLILSDGRKTPSYDEIITLIVSATKMCDYQILTNVITSSKERIIFEKSPNILSLIIDLKDDNAIKSLLNNCIASVKEYPRLLDLAECSVDDIAGDVLRIINKSLVTSDVNVHLLTMAFSYLCENKCILFEQCISLCPDHDAFIDDNDTFLTKIIKERNISQIKEAMNICKFDINKHNKMDEAAICLACKDEDEDKVQYLMGNGNMKIIEYDIFLAKKIAWAIKDENKLKRIVALLK